MKMETNTTMKVSIKNRDRLAKLAKYGESLDDALTRLFQKAELQKGKGDKS